ncbi:sugar phosphate isomerase/epimerase [Micromonospora polyrhachis]|uniref:Inosose dehydratase n=1 Tax=Micromonospora polyrhachis TaxID=1282883 RepID=A0A7W7SWF4_9ACTN|nr:TIM barrel protein [Micromonospora polyrhachis]MBB4962196.1 inosose dehydratase [Micromonospora polyrhachis]
MAMRIAGAPISWGVCEVPGWGHQMTAERVLTEMAGTGIIATEFGPDGFLPTDPVQRRELLTAYGLTAVGGFVPVLLHDPGHDPLPEVLAHLPAFLASGANTLVLAAATEAEGYDQRPVLDAAGWRTLLGRLDALAGVTADHGVVATLHPHVGTMVERAEEVWRVLDGSVVGLCLDTGHLLVGGADPVEVARKAAGRTAHVHLKDVNATLASRVRAGAIGYRDAVAAGMYRPLGDGDVGIAEIVTALTDAGYPGWYVMEQDAVLASEPADGTGPLADVRRSLAYLASVGT